jgi:hypothetical protein
MKYFTAEIWAGWQGDDVAFEKARKKWDTNRANYQRSLRRLTPRLGKLQGNFFTNHSLHDGRLLLFAVSDWPAGKSDWRTPPETRVELAVLAGTKKALIYKLTYKGVQEISVQTKNDLFPLECSRFGDWGYDELLPAGKLNFRHNILFQTGTEISIAFQRFRYTRTEASKPELKRYTKC